MARAIQQQLFPASPRILGFDLGGASYPAHATGGDYFDFIPLGDGRLGIVIGDVSGHGLGPALLMASTRAYLRALARTHTHVSDILGVANRVLADDLGTSHFVTLTFAVLDPRTRSLEYASAGHPTGYVLDADGEVKATLPSTACPLGFLAEEQFPTGEGQILEPGDLVLFLTDGIVESRAPDGTVFGNERALDIVRLYRAEPGQSIVENLYHAVRAFCHNRAPLDDITAVVTKVDPPG